MELHLYNTLTKKKEVFTPIKPGHVSMYHCGPTVYNYAHIGNLRAFVFADILRRVAEFNKFAVTQVINITDIGELSSDGEDKMVKGLRREGKPISLAAMKEMADFYAAAFLKDLTALNILPAHHYPKASEYIPQQIAFIQKLEQKGFTYTTSDTVYFDTAKFADYGKLGGIDAIDTSSEISRIGLDSEKKSSRDFALWKLSTELGFPSPWGIGFPGWHIECSTMSIDLLGETFDIHTGGVDHIAIHHNNEIAQSEALTGKPFVHYWMHENFIAINDEKISKSLKNEMYLSQLQQNGISPIAYRYFLLTAHYRTLINVSQDALDAAQKAFTKLQTSYQSLGSIIGNVHEEYFKKFSTAVNDDLNTAMAIATVWEMLKDTAISDTDKKATLDSFDTVLGFNLSTLKPIAQSQKIIQVAGKEINITYNSSKVVSQEIFNLISKREEARLSKDWTTSDKLRDELNQQGYKLLNGEHGIILE